MARNEMPVADEDKGRCIDFLIRAEKRDKAASGIFFDGLCEEDQKAIIKIYEEHKMKNQ